MKEFFDFIKLCLFHVRLEDWFRYAILKQVIFEYGFIADEEFKKEFDKHIPVMVKGMKKMGFSGKVVMLTDSQIEFTLNIEDDSLYENVKHEDMEVIDLVNSIYDTIVKMKQVWFERKQKIKAEMKGEVTETSEDESIYGLRSKSGKKEVESLKRKEDEADIDFLHRVSEVVNKTKEV